MRRTRALSLAGILVSLWAPSTTWAKAPKHKRTPARAPMLVLHPRFHLIAASTSRFVTDGRYVVVARPTQGPGNQTATLIDDQTGTRTVLTFPAQCGLGDIGGGWVLAPCLGLSGPPYQVYSIAAGTWAPVATGTDAFGEVAIGTDWIEEYHQTPAACSEHCLYAYTFRNIATGETRLLPAWRPGGTTIPNLNSPDLSARLCPPLRVPQGFPQDETPTDAAPDPFSFAGRFAVGEEWFMQRGLWQLRLLLESCG